jgi:hypothetical protein
LQVDREIAPRFGNVAALLQSMTETQKVPAIFHVAGSEHYF